MPGIASSKEYGENHKLAQAITDALWGEFTRQLHYKADHHRRVVVQIDKWFPSSKTCSCRGHVLSELPLSVRKWKYPKCKITHDRIKMQPRTFCVKVCAWQRFLKHRRYK
ncbi:MAG TPA: hypothetical protein DCS93_23535 [Microscillaceae bacterium]|nr:hypothetical protein [Microscillaceae bacterium]